MARLNIFDEIKSALLRRVPGSQERKTAFKQLKEGPVSSVKKSAKAYLNPSTLAKAKYISPIKTFNQPSNLWTTPFARSVGSFQKKAEERTLPKVNLQQYADRIKSPVTRVIGKFGTGAAEQMINLPQRLAEAGGRLGVDIRAVQKGETPSLSRRLGTGAEIALPLLDIATAGRASAVKNVGVAAIKGAVKGGFKQGVKQGVKQGGAWGLLFGGLQGMSEGDKAEITNVIGGAVTGLAIGSTLGGFVGGVGGVIGLLKKKPGTITQLRDERGRYAPGDTPVKPTEMTKPQWDFQISFNKKYKRNPYTPVYQSDLQKALTYEAEKKGFGLSVRDVAEDVNPLGTKERGFVTSVKEAPNVPPEVKAKVEGTYRPKPNTKLMGEAQALLQDGASINFKNTKDLDKKVAATIQEAVNLQEAGRNQAAANLYNNLSEHGTELGRSVQAFSLLKKMSPEAIALSATGKIRKYNLTAKVKIPELTGIQLKEISKRVQEIDLLKGREKNIAINELSNTINAFIPSGKTDKFLAVWKAGLLTSFRTHERNFLGNSIHGIAELAKDLPGSAADIALSLKTGERTLTPGIKGLGEFGSKTTVQQVKDIVSKGYDPGEIMNKFDRKQITWGSGKVEQTLKTYTDAVFRTLGASDKPFYNAALARSLYSQAGSKAINAGKRGNKEFIEQAVKSPTAEMMKIAISDANVAVFKDKNMATAVASAIKRALGKKAWTKIGGEVTIPFTGVPSSIAVQIKNYSPVGLLQGIAKSGQVLLSDVPELQRQASQEFGRGVIGTGIFGLGSYLMSKGIITGQPKDAAEARQWQLENKPRNSIMIGGKWRSLNSIGPEAVVFLAGAKFNEESKGGGSLSSYGASIGKDLLDQSFVVGLQSPINALTDPQRYGKSYAGQLLSSPIPNIIKDLSKATDPISRETNTVSDYFKLGVPGLRTTLEPKRNVLGEVVKQQPTRSAAFYDLFNSKTPVSNDLVDELSRLYGEGSSATPSKLSPSQTIQKMKVKLTPKQLDSFEEEAGAKLSKELTKLIKTPEYQALTDDKKAKEIKKKTTTIRTEVKNSMDIRTLIASKFEKSSDAPKSALQTISLYGQGFFKDPAAVIASVRDKQPIRKLRGDAVVLERAQGLSAIDKGDKSTQVDHIIPLSLGGKNEQANLQIISKEDNKAKAAVEVYLGKLLSSGDISRKEAQERVAKWEDEIKNVPAAAKDVAERKAADDIFGSIQGKTAQEVGRILQQEEASGRLTKSVADRISILQTEKRAKWILEQIEGKNAQEIGALLKQYEERGILTKSVADNIKELRK